MDNEFKNTLSNEVYVFFNGIIIGKFQWIVHAKVPNEELCAIIT